MEEIKQRLENFFINYVDNKGKLLADYFDIDELVERTANYITRGIISIKLYQKKEREYNKSEIEDEIYFRNENGENINITRKDLDTIVDIYQTYLGNDDSWHLACKNAINDFLESKENKGDK